MLRSFYQHPKRTSEAVSAIPGYDPRADLSNAPQHGVEQRGPRQASQRDRETALHAEADIFLMDEFFGGVGDAQFRKKAFEVFKDTMVNGKTIVLVSHNLEIIKKHAHRVLVLDKGKVITIAEPAEAIREYNKIINH